MRNAKLALLSALIFLGACKSRQIAIHKIDSTAVHHIAINSDSTATHRDTGHTDTHTIAITTDSGKTTTEITPDSGATINVNLNTGEVTGHIKKVVRTEHKAAGSQTKTDIHEQAGKIDSVELKKETVKSDNTHVVSKIKDVQSKPNYSWIIWVACGLLLIGGVVYLLFRFKIL